MKFILKNKIIKVLMVLFFLQSALTLSLNRVASKVSKLPDNFDATMTISNKSDKEVVEVSLNKNSLFQTSSGIQVTLRTKTDKVKNSAFFAADAAAGVYFLPFRNFVSSIDCQSANWFYSQNGLTFFVFDKENYTVSFTFPKRMFRLFGNQISNTDATDLCNKISDNIRNYATQSKVNKSNAIKEINDAVLLDEKRTANIKSKEEQEAFIKKQEEKKKKMEAEKAEIEKKKTKLMLKS